MTRYLSLLPVLAILGVFCGPARAQTIAAILQQWGMVGTWSAGCELPAMQAPRVTYNRAADGSVQIVVDYGPGRSTTSQLLEARPDGQTLQLTSEDARERVTYVLLKGEDGRVRSISSRGTSGGEYIRDGKLVATGTPTAWLQRCG